MQSTGFNIRQNRPQSPCAQSANLSPRTSEYQPLVLAGITHWNVRVIHSALEQVLGFLALIALIVQPFSTVIKVAPFQARFRVQILMHSRSYSLS